jgi:TPR repeat protein
MTPLTAFCLITGLLLGPAAAFAQSAPASAPAPSAGAAEISGGEMTLQLGLPQYALEQCRGGQGFFCEFLAGLLQSLDKRRLPESFSTDLRLDELAARAFEADCGQGNTYGCFQLGMRLKGQSRDAAAEKTFQRAVRICTAACTKKYWPGCLLLLSLSRDADATPAGEAKRKEFLKRSCEGGFAPACQHPATEEFFTAMNSGSGPSQLGGASLEWLCGLGGASHCALLGWTELLGMPGPNPDSAAALGHFQKACDLGDGMGCAMLARMHLAGEATPKNPEQARALMQKACLLKFEPACQALAITN